LRANNQEFFSVISFLNFGLTIIQNLLFKFVQKYSLTKKVFFMKKNYQKFLMLFLFLWIGTEGVKGQIIYEPFAGTGDLNGQNGWLNHSGAAGEVKRVAGSLNYTGLATSTDNKIQILSTQSEDLNKGFSSLTSGAVYASFVMRVSDVSKFNANANLGQYFMHFAEQAGGTFTTFNYVARLYVHQGSATNTYQLGIVSKGGGTLTVAIIYGSSPQDLAINTNYFIVIKYDIATQTSSLFINPVPGNPEPSPTHTSTFGSSVPSDLESICVRNSNSSGIGTGDIEIDELRVGTDWASVTPSSSPTPTITVTPASLSGFTTTVGSPSASQNYTLSGSNLTPASGSITVTAPTDYEVSTDNTTFSGSVSVPYSGGTLASTPIYVRIAASAPVGSPSGNVTNAGGGATTQNVAVSGTVNPITPFLTVTPATLSGFTTTTGTASASQNYTLSGGNLTPASGSITVTAPTDYEVSTDNTTFSGSVSVPYSGGTLASTPIYVRIAASAPVGSPSGNVTNAGGGASTQNVAVSGTVNPVPTVVPIATIRNSISAAPNLEQVAPYAVGTPVIVRGVLHGVNRYVDAIPANGTKQKFEFALIDNSGVRSGITVRLNGTVDVAPIDLQEGDSVQISGKVDQFRGLTQVDVNGGSVTRLATGRPRKTPVTATVIGEDQESNLIKLENVSITGTWPPTPHTGSGFNVNITVGSNTYVMRITSASELFNKTYAQVFGASEPTTGITIIGVGGQFGGTSAPFNTGYQIFPYRLSDIIAPVPIVPELGSNAPTAGFDFGTVRKNEVSASVSYKLKGKDLPITGSNTNTVVTAPANFQVSKNNTDFFDFITFTNAEVMADSVNVFVRFAPVSEINGFKGGDITNAVPAVSPTLNVNVAVKGTQAEPLSLADELATQVKVYPNPAQNTIQIESNQWYEVELQDITGRTIANFASNEIVKIDNLANGLYILQFKKDNIKFAKRLIVQK